MLFKQYSDRISKAVAELADFNPCSELYHCHNHCEPVPSMERIRRIVELCRAVIFPGYFGEASSDRSTLLYHIGVDTEDLFEILTLQIQAALCFSSSDDDACLNDTRARQEKAAAIAADFIGSLPSLRDILATDVRAMYNGDPAAGDYNEIIACYPTIRAVTCQRIAHCLLGLGVPLLPRVITEIAHSETGIDINPGARIGSSFCIDHGTGVVIGQTCIIGNNVKLYQGVTLGARSFPLDENGNPVKGIDRHPIIEDNVTIYANATILGRVTIGKGAVIGGNVWLTRSVAPGEIVTI